MNLGALDQRFQSGAQVTPETMVQVGLLRNLKQPVKVLAKGEVTKPLSVTAHRFSAQARQQLEAAGGTAEQLPGRKRGKDNAGDLS